MAERRNVVYITAVPLADESNGGNLCCRNHVRRLQEDPGIALFVIAIARVGSEAATSSFLAGLGVPHAVVVPAGDNLHPSDRRLRSALGLAGRVMTQYPWELLSMNQTAIDQLVSGVIHRRRPDWVVIDYLFSALFCESVFESSAKVALVTLNQEAAFYRQMIDLGLVRHGPWTARASAYRLARKERQLHEACDKLIAIGASDLPHYVQPERSACVTPYLDVPPQPWQFTAESASDVFFVGNLGHFPNRLAIEYLALRLAPAVAARRPDLRFKIVGATQDDVPPAWRHPQVDYLGVADGDTVAALFRSAGLFVCPVSNEFGMKFKLAEAIAYGIPTCAAPQSRQCIPYAPSVPALAMDQPDAAAEAVSALAGNESALRALSAAITRERDAFMTDQAGVWARTLG